ncbi:hypothetical protein TNCV_3239651 [Trichonephila clavipes]|nr:hypothetical protein TNCV_3239651 [Trichonephila clavipes]
MSKNLNGGAGHGFRLLDRKHFHAFAQREEKVKSPKGVVTYSYILGDLVDGNVLHGIGQSVAYGPGQIGIIWRSLITPPDIVAPILAIKEKGMRRVTGCSFQKCVKYNLGKDSMGY